MKDEYKVRFLLSENDPKAANFVYKPPESGPSIAQNATLGVKFANARIILDDWHLIGGTRWSRALYRLRHPIVYLRRGLKKVYRRIKHFFFGDPPAYLYRKWVTKEQMLKEYPNKRENYGTDQTKAHVIQPDQGID